MSAELVERLPVFGLRVGVVHDAAAHREVRGLADDGRCSDRDVPVQRPVPRDVTEGTGVHAATVRLESLDDLHRPRLRRTGDRATGEGRLEEIGDSDVLAEPPAHDALQVMDVRERTQFFQDRYVDAPELAHFPEVVAFQVDDHYVLRRILLAREQFRRESAVLGRGRPSRPSALDWPRLDLPPSDLEEPFRTRGQDAMVARIEVAAVW